MKASSSRQGSLIRNRRSGQGNAWIVALLAVAAVLLIAGIGWYLVKANRANTDAAPILHVVERGLFNHTVVEQGEVESSKNIELRCEVKARTGSGPSTSIIKVVPEGTEVKEGDELVVLDSSSLEQESDRQQVVVNSSDALVTQAKNTYEATLIAKEEYLQGTYKQSEQTNLSAIFVAEENVRRAKQHAKYSERLAAKGYVTALQLEGDLFAVEKANMELKTAQENLRVLQELTKKKTEKTFDSDIHTAKTKWETEEKSHAIEIRKLNEIKAQIAKCTIRAPAAGSVVYANITSSRGGSSEFVVEPGAPVREQQAILRLPDAEFMQVKAKVNESRITLVKAGMPVVITCDALEGKTLAGEVTRVNQYAEPTSYFGSPVKVYSTFIRIIDAPPDIRTGLTAQVSIQINRRENVLQIPIQAVIEHGTKTYCLVMGPNKRLEPRAIQIGASNDKFVMIDEDLKPDGSITKVADDGIRQGLAAGEHVVMNPRDYLHKIKLPDPPPVPPEQAEALKKAEEAAKNKPAESPAPPRQREGEGSGSPGGERPRGNRGNPGEFFTRLDKDGNGKLSKDELPGFMTDRVGEVDTNGDGDVDRTEFMAALPKMRPQGGGGPGGGPPGGGP